jgi:catechol 2,3-dioxygenase-like lactoylglutathione lyase family enzyme
LLTHITIGAKDTEASAAFYEAVLTKVGYTRGPQLGKWASFSCGEGQPPILVGAPFEGEAKPANGLMLGFRAESPAQVDAAHAAGLQAGGTDDGAPGPRPNGPPGIYAAYLRDPTGNKIGVFGFMS